MGLGFVMVSGDLAAWGQAAAFVLALYLFFSILVGLALTAVLLFAFAWIRSKAELIKNLRPNLNRLNQALVAAKKGDPLPPEVADTKFVQIVAEVPKAAAQWPAAAISLEKKVEDGSDRVAGAVIELRARTEMVKGMARAFFLPGSLQRSRKAIVPVKPVTKREVKREVEHKQMIENSEPEVVREPPRYGEEVTVS